MAMEAYLDNAATTKVPKEIYYPMIQAMELEYGNPSSMHRMGIKAEQLIKEAKEKITKSLKAEAKEIIFTSGGTEANNMALIGTAMANQRAGKHIITTKFEHASVYQPLLFLKEQGFEITFLSVDQNGKVSEQELASLIRNDTILVSIMYVNNEIGCTQDILTLSKIIKEKNKNTLFHVDAIQAYGKYNICPKKEGIDLLSVSGHKLHAPKGSGFLYIKDKVKVKPIFYGGGQQKGMRSGTENVPAIVGLGAAVELYYTNHEEKIQQMYQLKKQFIEGIEQIEGTIVNAIYTDEKEKLCLEQRILQTAPHIVSVSFEGISKGEVLLHALEERGVYVSSGSACSTNHPGISGSLRAIGVRENLLDSTLRFSFSLETTTKEIEYALEQVKVILPMLRRFQKR